MIGNKFVWSIPRERLAAPFADRAEREPVVNMAMQEGFAPALMPAIILLHRETRILRLRERQLIRQRATMLTIRPGTMTMRWTVMPSV